jgi:hypothetical protein
MEDAETGHGLLPSPHPLALLTISPVEYVPAGQVVQAESPATEYCPATHSVQTVCAVSAAYVLASQLAQTVEPVPPNFHTPARVQIWLTQLQATILMYRATTGSMNISSLFCLLLLVAVGKNLTPPFACDCTEENPEFGSRECCTSTSVTY